MRLEYGNIAVPWPVMWSEEEEYFVGICPWFKAPAICQKEAQGEGVPRFGRPHTGRQRKLLALGLCDVCAKPLRHATKISLRNFKGRDVGGRPVTQVEPLLHVECARLSLQRCPSLQRQREAGTLRIKQAFRYRARPMIAQPEDRLRYVPDYVGPNIIGLAAIDLLSWRDCSVAEW
jgi:hypothetical protein